MSERIKTGIRKDGSFGQNLASVRKAVAVYGPERVIDRLQFMKHSFYWIKSDPEWQEQIDHLVAQIEYDVFIVPYLTEEIEINEIVSGEGEGFKYRKRKIRIIVDPTKGEPESFEDVLY